MLTILVINAQAGNQEAMLQLIARFQPLLKKHARILNYEDSYNDLVLRFIETIHNAKIDTIKNKSEGAIVNYIARSVYHSYCKLVEQAIAQRTSPYSLDELSRQQLYSSDAYHSPEAEALEFPKNLLTPYEEQILRLIYERDLSISKIAQKNNISRQAINQVKLRAECKLRNYYLASNE